MVYGTVNNVTVTDTLRENLQLVVDEEHPISIAPNGDEWNDYSSTENGFTITANQLSKEANTTASYKEYKITYWAKIKDEALAGANGIIEKVANTVRVDFNNNESVFDTVSPSYSQFWVDKSTGVLQEDGRVKWTITVNEC